MQIQKENEENVDEILELPSLMVERLICKQLLSPNKFENMLFVKDNFKANWFQTECFVPLFQMLYTYISKYQDVPSKELVTKILENEKFEKHRVAIKKELIDIYAFDETNYSDKFIQDTIISFVKGRAVYYAILDNIDDIEKNNNISTCVKQFEKIMQLGISDDLGVEYFENLNNHITDLTTNEVRIPFKWNEWDKYTYGGIPVNQPCMFIVMAQPGLGKSQMMMNIRI